MATKPDPHTADEVLELPLPQGVSGYEFIDGRPVPVMPASGTHSRLMGQLAHLLITHVEEQGDRGRVYVDGGFVLGLDRDPERMRGPDVAYVTEQNVLEYGESFGRFLRFAPDLAVEIDLASGRKSGGLERILDYLEAGTRLVWAIQPHTRTAMVYRPDGSARIVREGEALDGEDVLPGFRVMLADLLR